MLIFLTPEWVEAISTTVYALVTIGGLIYIISQTRAAHRQADIAEMAAKAAQQSADALVMIERAWIVVTIHPILPAETLTPREVTIVTEVTNYGKTPAWITGVTAMLNIGEFDDVPLPHDSINYGPVTYGRLPDEPKYGNTTLITTVPILTSGQSMTLSLVIGQGDFSKIRIGKASAYVYGIIKYRDIFGHSPQSVRFCYSYDTDGLWRAEGLIAYDSQSNNMHAK